MLFLVCFSIDTSHTPMNLLMRFKYERIERVFLFEFLLFVSLMSMPLFSLSFFLSLSHFLSLSLSLSLSLFLPLSLSLSLSLSPSLSPSPPSFLSSLLLFHFLSLPAHVSPPLFIYPAAAQLQIYPGPSCRLEAPSVHWASCRAMNSK